MVIAWIVVTLFIALAAWGLTWIGTGDAFDGFIAAVVIVQISTFIAVVYIAGHFISKYW